MEDIRVVINIPESFNIKLERYLLDLRERGIRKTKAQILPMLAEIGLRHESKELNN